MVSHFQEIKTTLKVIKKAFDHSKTSQMELSQQKSNKIIDSCILKAMVHSYELNDFVQIERHNLRTKKHPFNLINSLAQLLRVFKVTASHIGIQLIIVWSKSIPRVIKGD